MRARLMFLVAAAALVTSPVAALAAGSCPLVSPGKGIGPIALGATRTALEKTGLAVTPGAHDNHLNVGPYEVWLEAGKVVTVGADSARVPCVRLGREDASLGELLLEELGARMPAACSAIEHNEGASVVACREGVTFYQHMGGKEVRVSAQVSPVATPCHRWVAPGGVERKLVFSADVSDGVNVCVGARVFTSAIVPDDILKITGKHHISTCSRQDNRGATVVDCPFDGLRLVFAGPGLRLARVESIAVRER